MSSSTSRAFRRSSSSSTTRCCFRTSAAPPSRPARRWATCRSRTCACTSPASPSQPAWSSFLRPGGARAMAVDLRRRAALQAIGLASLATLAPARAVRAQAEHPLTRTIWELNTGERSVPENLPAALRAARFRLLGEVHDNPAHHAIRLKLLDALGGSGLKPAVAFEQFDRAHDKALQQRLAAGDVTADAVAQ